MHRGKNTLLHIAAMLAAAVDVLLGYWFVATNSSLMHLLSFALHVGLAFGFSRIFKNIKAPQFEENSNFVQVSFVLTAVIPAYGMIGFLCVYLGLRKLKTPERAIFEVDEFFQPDQNKAWMRDVDQYERDVEHNEMEVDSFRDVLRSNDRQLEENVINKLSKTLTKNSVMLLQEVVRTSTSDTRILAASALIEIEDKVIARIEELRTQLDAAPDDNDKVLELARIYGLYCYLGVLDSVIEKHYQKLTLEQYQSFVLMNPEHTEAGLEYGRILLNSGRIKEAIKTLRTVMMLSPGDMNPQIWLAEAYYRAAEYDNVRELCCKLADSSNLPENIKEVVYYWSPTKMNEVGKVAA